MPEKSYDHWRSSTLNGERKMTEKLHENWNRTVKQSETKYWFIVFFAIGLVAAFAIATQEFMKIVFGIFLLQLNLWLMITFTGRVMSDQIVMGKEA